MTNFYEILETVEISSALIRENDILNENAMYPDIQTWFSKIQVAATEWKLYAPEVIKIVNGQCSSKTIDQLIVAIGKLNKLTDSDGKEELLSFLQKVKLQTYTSQIPSYDEQTSFVCQVIQKALMNPSLVKESTDIYEAKGKGRMTLDKFVQQETDRLTKEYKKKFNVSKISELPTKDKEAFYKDLEKAMENGVKRFQNDDVDLELE